MSMEHINAMALTMLKPAMSPIQLIRLYRQAGSATAIVEDDGEGESSIYHGCPRLREVMLSLPQAMEKAEEEWQFCEKHHIQVLIPSDEAYPQRIKDCDDAPLVLYYRGNADLNAGHVVNMIGTRKSTAYGSSVIRSFVEELHQACPDTLVISGLAYGIDICAHRAALKYGMKTVGVLAHGLNMIYPSMHRETAKDMVSHGGLLTEYFSAVRPEKRNFVQRNRIVAGISDATILVESARRGGGLITCDISRGYGREVFAFPGSVTSLSSEGCNNYLRDGKAHLITSAQDFMKQMGWGSADVLVEARKKGIERDLFPNLSPDEERIVSVLQECGEMQVCDIVVRTAMPLSQVNATLFLLEMNGVVRSMAGGRYCI